MSFIENPTFITAMASFLGVVIVGLIGLKGNMHKTIMGSTDASRVQLSADEAKFRDDLLKSVDSYQSDVKELRIEVESLRTVNNDLKLQTIDLMKKINELTTALDKYTACKI